MPPSPQPVVPFWALTINLTLCGLGAGILSLPWTLAGAGILNAAVWNIVVLWITYYTFMLLINAAEKTDCYVMDDLLRLSFATDKEKKKADKMDVGCDGSSEAESSARPPGSSLESSDSDSNASVVETSSINSLTFENLRVPLNEVANAQHGTSDLTVTDEAAAGDNVTTSSDTTNLWQKLKDPNQSATILCTVSVWLLYPQSLIMYLIIIADCVKQIVISSFSGDPAIIAEQMSEWRWLVILCSTIICGGLCFLDHATLAFTSAVGIFANCFIVFAIAWNFGVIVGADEDQVENAAASSTNGSAEQMSILMFTDATESNNSIDPLLQWQSHPHLQSPLPENLCLFGLTAGNISYITSMVMATHAMITPIYETMQNRSPKTFAKSLGISMIFLYAVFTGFAVLAYLSYGDRLFGDVLKNLPQGAWYSVVSQGSIAFSCVGIYPFVLHPMRAPVKSKSARSVITVIVCVSVGVISLFIEELGIMNIIAGSVGVFFFVGLFPGIIAWKLLGYQLKYCVVMAGMGLVMMVLGLVFLDNQAQVDDLSENCRWRLTT